jgi:excisionase family DNA binding protein
MDEQRRMLLTAAARRLGISNTTIRKMVADGKLTTYENPLDGRQKLVDVAAVEALEKFRPVREDDQDVKIAA